MSGPLQKPGEDINIKAYNDEWTVTEARRRYKYESLQRMSGPLQARRRYKYQSLQRMSGPLQKPGEDINIKAYNG